MLGPETDGTTPTRRPLPNSVMLIESDGILLGLMDRTLRDWGVARTLLFRDGASALTGIPLDKFDCALVDLASAKGAASTLLSTLQTAGVPFALSLGFAHESAAGHKHGPVLVKPFSDDDLYHCVSGLMFPSGGLPAL